MCVRECVRARKRVVRVGCVDMGTVNRHRHVIRGRCNKTFLTVQTFTWERTLSNQEEVSVPSLDPRHTQQLNENCQAYCVLHFVLM